MFMIWTLWMCFQNPPYWLVPTWIANEFHHYIQFNIFLRRIPFLYIHPFLWKLNTFSMYWSVNLKFLNINKLNIVFIFHFFSFNFYDKFWIFSNTMPHPDYHRWKLVTFNYAILYRNLKTCVQILYNWLLGSCRKKIATTSLPIFIYVFLKESLFFHLIKLKIAFPMVWIFWLSGSLYIT